MFRKLNSRKKCFHISMARNSFTVIGATIALVLLVVVVVAVINRFNVNRHNGYISSKEHFQEKKKSPFNLYSDDDDDDYDDDGDDDEWNDSDEVGSDGLPRNIEKYKTYFREDSSIAAIRIHAYKVQNISSWSEHNLHKFDEKNFKRPTGNPIDRMTFVEHDDALFKHFKEKYEAPHKPCVITNMADDWPASRLWSFKYLNDKYGNHKFAIGNENELKFKYWYHYATHPKHRLDDNPIYIFDQRFLERPGTSTLGTYYDVPKWFDEDELSTLPASIRPPFAWLIVGIPRSGSSLHTDPLGTHAWNTLVCGKKRWVIFPPDTKIEKKHKTLTGHLWFNQILPQLKGQPHHDFIQEKGDTVFLPANWWHITLVIEDSICVTQNFVGKSNMNICRRSMMKERPKVYKHWMAQRNMPIREEERFVREDVFDSTDSELTEDEGK